MANAGPGKLTISGSIGPGQAVTSQIFTDVASLEFDFMRNVVGVRRTGSGGTQYYDLSALTTGTIAFTAGLPTFVLS